MKKQAINLGRIGILLPLAAIVPVVGSLAGIAGLILLLISFYNFSKYYSEPVIFRNALLAFIIPLISGIIGGIVIVVTVGLTALGLSGQNVDSMGFQEILSLFFGSGLAIFGIFLLYAGYAIGYFLLYKALKKIGQKSNMGIFNTAGLLYFIGALTTIVGLGFLLMFIAWIIHIIALFTIKADETTEEQAAPETTA